MYAAIQRLDKKFDVLHRRVTEMNQGRTKPMFFKPVSFDVISRSSTVWYIYHYWNCQMISKNLQERCRSCKTKAKIKNTGVRWLPKWDYHRYKGLRKIKLKIFRSFPVSVILYQWTEVKSFAILCSSSLTELWHKSDDARLLCQYLWSLDLNLRYCGSSVKN